MLWQYGRVISMLSKSALLLSLKEKSATAVLFETDSTLMKD